MRAPALKEATPLEKCLARLSQASAAAKPGFGPNGHPNFPRNH
jgi:hypothetical protein